MSETTAPPLVQMRTCPGCRVRKPVSQFNNRPLLNVCDTCAPDALYSRAMQRRRQEIEREFRQILDVNNVPGYKRAPKMDEMLGQLMEEFGGTHQFVHELAEQMKGMMVLKPGHPETVRLFQAVLKLVHENNKRQDAADREPMTLEQIEKAKEVALFQMVTELVLDREKADLFARLLAPVEAAEKELLEREAAQAGEVIDG